MDWQNFDRTPLTEDDTRLPSTSNSPEASSMRILGGKPDLDWEKPDFEEFDLCMEVTAYVQTWE
jgi:coenzyme PQQ precursor peptide PqqA